MNELIAFLDGWSADPINAKSAFGQYKEILEKAPGAELEFVARPGVSYSLRGKKKGGNRPVFALVDVVDDEPDNRWLSVCFYADLVTDPDEAGDFVPQGLLGEDALCFNLDADDPAMREYIARRLVEAASQS